MTSFSMTKIIVTLVEKLNSKYFPRTNVNEIVPVLRSYKNYLRRVEGKNF